MAGSALDSLVTVTLKRFSALSMTQRIIGCTVLLGLAFSSVLLFRGVSDDYDVLYSNMSLPDAAATAAKLKELNKNYRLTDGGTTILVEAKDKNQLMLETAAELTSDQPVSLTKIPPVLQGDVQKEWLRKFNSDTISTTIQSIQGIRKAQVIVASPEETVFTANRQSVQASVMLVVEPGFRLKDSQIKTIKNLVAHAVPGLKADDVAISDNFGNSLDDGIGAPGGIGGSRDESERRRKDMEKELQIKIMRLLEPIVGKDNAVVSVTTELNLDEARAKIHSVVPTQQAEGKATGVIVSEQKQLEEYSGAKPGTATSDKGEGTPSEPGVTKNTSPIYKSDSTAGDAANKQEKQYRSEKNTTNYAHSEEDREVIYASGTVKRMSVAVALNKVLTNTEMDELKGMIASAAGLDLQRGDKVDLRGFQFSQAPDKPEKPIAEALKATQDQEFIVRLVYLGVLVALGLTGLFMVYSLLKRPAQAELLDEDDYGAYGDGGYGAYGGAPLTTEGQAALAALAGGNATDAQIRLLGQQTMEKGSNGALPILENPLSEASESIRSALYATIEHDPAEAARLLVGFMRDD